MAGRTKAETPEQKQYREQVEQIASNIAALAGAVKSLIGGPLKRDALIILLAQSSGQPQDRVRKVLAALENLGTDWLK